MIRQILTPTQNQVILQLPDDMVGKEVEIIAFNLKEPQFYKENNKSSIATLRQELKGITTDLSNFRFSRDEANDYE